jgi:hypothetical protein
MYIGYVYMYIGYVYMYIGSLGVDGSGEMDADADTSGGSWPGTDSQRRTIPGYAHAPGMYIFTYIRIYAKKLKKFFKYETNILEEIYIYNFNIFILYNIYLSYIYNMPVVKQDITKMSVEELASYVEAVREKRRQRSKKHYDEVIKNDPEKYKMFLNTYVYAYTHTYVYMYVCITTYIRTHVCIYVLLYNICIIYISVKSLSHL